MTLERPDTWDLSALETTWARRRARLQPLAARVRREGMTRPQRNPAERAWLEGRGEAPPTAEVATSLNEQGSTPLPRSARSDPASREAERNDSEGAEAE